MKTKILFTLLLFIGLTAFSQNNLQIIGKINDARGETITGAIVSIKGTNSYSTTDSIGRFNISTDKKYPLALVVQYIGFKPQEIQVNELTVFPIEISLKEDNLLSEVVVSARRRQETAQEVPVPITVIGGPLIQDAGAFNVNRLKELVPSVQLYSSNPRNTGLNIRGLGSSFGLTNDGLDPGVGFYVDGVYYARPAVTTLDFIDVEQIEVVRGPQGTLFGKNTTAGAFIVTTRKPSFTPGVNYELSFGNYGYIQAKASVTGPIAKKLAVRISFSGTQRDGLIKNITTGKYVNDINNIGTKVQLLWKPTDKIAIALAGDVTSQKPDGYAQVYAGTVKTKRAAYRQFDAIIKDLNYTLPSQNAFDRVIDHDTPWKSGNELAGASLNIDVKLGKGILTSTTAWRYWNWDPSNDRDFTGLQALAKSQNPSKHQNWSQEIRYAGKFTSYLSGVVGLYAIGQQLTTNGTEESGSAQWRFSQSSTSTLWQTPGLFEGYGVKTNSSINSLSAAVFAQLDWEVFKGFHFLPGVRYNYDEKKMDYDRKTYGGIVLTDPALIALRKGVYSDQAFKAQANESNLSGQLTLAYKPINQINLFATYSTGFKPVGVNVAGLPTKGGKADTALAVIKPEYVEHYEFGLKTSPTTNSTVNITFYNTDIKNYQTNVQSPELGVNRGYLANADKVNVRGIELDANIRVNKYLLFYGAGSYTEGKYVSFTNAPLPLEETGNTENGVQVAFKDVSGGRLPGISKWAGSLGGEINLPGNLIGRSGNFFLAVESFYRSDFSSSPSPSQYLNVNGYALLNGRLGFRATEGLSL
ncbi:MAG: TonB-dependent receptor, partial [Bacteroidia bacterium]|nr:TonB-dependent receptor [Bacteroidia bacterium]